MEVCRICLSENTEKDVFSLPNELQVEKTVQEVIMFCLNIEISEDSKFDTLLCKTCHSSIIEFYKFKVLAHKSDEQLKLRRKYKTEDQKDDKLNHESVLDEIEIKQEINEFDVKYENLDNDSESNYIDEFTFEIGDPVADDSITLNINKKRDHSRNYKVEGEKKCPVCHINVRYLKNHMRSHMPKQEKPTCADCGRKFQTLSHLINHIDKVHLNPQQWKCELCNKNVLDLVKHNKKHHNPLKEVRCEFCSRTYSNVRGLEKHMCMHLKEKRFFCDDCDTSYYVKLALEVHIRKKHLKLFYQCEQCDKAYSRRYHLDRHRQLSHIDPLTANTTGDVCPICGKTYRQLKNHMATHLPKDTRQVYHCKICDKGYASRAGLGQHNTFLHARKRERCTICDKEVAHIKQHMLRLHSSRSFACNCCELRFASDMLLRAHVRSHSDERLFECAQCGNRYKSKSTLGRHIQRIHVGERRFLCQICSKGFFSKDHLERHLIAHSDERKYKCEICQKSMKTAKDLRIHMERHEGVKKYQCPVCGMAFVVASNFFAHKLTHSKIKRHPCRFCGVKFGRSDHRNRHERTAHVKKLESLKKETAAGESN